VFESPERRFNFRELMAWCRWEDARTCCEYLITRSISDEIDPKNLLRLQKVNNSGFFYGSGYSMHEMCSIIINGINSAQPNAMQSVSNNEMSYKKKQKQQQQVSMKKNVVQTSSIPTATCAKEAWDQWFIGDHEKGLFQPIKQFTKEMIRIDRRKFSERQTLASAFTKYGNYEIFEVAYSGYTNTYSKILGEVRKRKRENNL
jgi:hypothetical protein